VYGIDLLPVGYALKLGGAAIVILVLGVLGIVIFGNIWARVGIGAAIVVVFGGLLFWAWTVDRKDKAKRAGIDELPRV
jgi:Flp pilus assembly protein TadB